MKSLTEQLWFEVPGRRGFVNITETVAALVRKSGVQEGLCLANSLQIYLLGLFAGADCQIFEQSHHLRYIQSEILRPVLLRQLKHLQFGIPIFSLYHSKTPKRPFACRQ
jgi:hypothetical protein